MLQVLGEIAAVIGVDERRLVGHRLGRDRVAPAQLDAVDAELARGEIDHGLDHVGVLRPAGAAIRAGELVLVITPNTSTWIAGVI